MDKATGKEGWYQCSACGDVAKNPLECCGQAMEHYYDKDEYDEFQNFILEEEFSEKKKNN